MSCIEGVKEAQKWGPSSGKKHFFFTIYFVTTGNPSYLGGKKNRILVFHKIYQILEVIIAQF